MHVPERMAANVVKAPAGEFLTWSEFFGRTHSIVTTLEVTLEEASGAKAIDPARLETAIRSGRIVVAVTQGNPTSVSPAAEAITTP